MTSVDTLSARETAFGPLSRRLYDH